MVCRPAGMWGDGTGRAVWGGSTLRWGVGESNAAHVSRKLGVGSFFFCATMHGAQGAVGEDFGACRKVFRDKKSTGGEPWCNRDTTIQFQLIFSGVSMTVAKSHALHATNPHALSPHVPHAYTGCHGGCRGPCAGGAAAWHGARKTGGGCCLSWGFGDIPHYDSSGILFGAQRYLCRF